MSGYIKLFRGWRDTDGLLPSAKFSDFEAWLWLLENCAWKPIARWNAKGEEIRLEPGQIHVSIRSLTTAWGWSRKAVTTFLARLERVQKVRLQRGQSGTILTICNWSKYQANGDGQGDSREAGRGTVGGQSGDTQEEGKEGKEDNKPEAKASSDAVFWQMALDYIGQDKRPLIGKWIKEYTRPRVAEAIAAAQVERAVDPIPYIAATLRKRGRRGDGEEMTMPC